MFGTIEALFFQLLQVSIGTRDSLDRTPTSEEWTLLFEMSKKQALPAIAFAGIKRLRTLSDSNGSAQTGSPLKRAGSNVAIGAKYGIDAVTYLKWLGLADKIAQRNTMLNAECSKVCAELSHDGLQCCVLKGQSNLVNYPEELRECRTSGDIDLWVKTVEGGIPIAVSSGGSAEYVNYKGIAGVVEYAQQVRRIQGQPPIPWDRILYHHVEMITDSGEEVELHYRPSFLCSPLRNRRMQRWFEENEQFQTLSTSTSSAQAESPCVGRERCLNSLNIPLSRGNEGGFPIPTVSFNAVYQLLHIYKHLFDEGIGLRQLLDYYFVLRALHIERPLQLPCLGEGLDHQDKMLEWAKSTGKAAASNEDIMHTLGRFGMKKFAGAVMWVLQTVFSMPDEYLLCPAEEKEGKFLLEEIMQAGNFGEYDERICHSSSQVRHAWEKLKHNFRLIRHYPEEVVWEPVFRVCHFFWRRFCLWKWS